MPTKKELYSVKLTAEIKLINSDDVFYEQNIIERTFDLADDDNLIDGFGCLLAQMARHVIYPGNLEDLSDVVNSFIGELINLEPDYKCEFYLELRKAIRRAEDFYCALPSENTIKENEIMEPLRNLICKWKPKQTREADQK